MSIGTSGRVVIEVDPGLKRSLHSTLARRGQTLKDWFVEQAETYLASDEQLKIAPDNNDFTATYTETGDGANAS